MDSNRLTVVRPSRIWFAFIAVWYVFFESFGIGALAEGHYGGGLFLLIVWWPFMIPTVLGQRDEVRIEGDRLIARGWFREASWPRGDVTSIDVVTPPWAPNLAYLVLTATDGHRARLPGTTGSPWLWDARRRSRQQATLRRWLEGRPSA